MKTPYVYLFVMLASATLEAAEEQIEAPLPPTLEAPAAVPVEQQRAEEQYQEHTDSVSSGVTVVRGEQATIYEHRGRGGLYRTEVDPKHGPSYLFDDTDGNGAVNDGVSGDPRSQETQMWNLMKW